LALMAVPLADGKNEHLRAAVEREELTGPKLLRSNPIGHIASLAGITINVPAPRTAVNWLCILIRRDLTSKPLPPALRPAQARQPATA
jgi:hypothetical protein